MNRFHEIARADEIEPGQGRVVEAEGREIALFNLEGAFYAVENTCCHRGGPLGEGALDGGEVICPWHGWRFDVRSGECRNSPGDHVRTYDVIVEEGAVRVKI